jgi:hypothetical protein
MPKFCEGGRRKGGGGYYEGGRDLPVSGGTQRHLLDRITDEAVPCMKKLWSQSAGSVASTACIHDSASCV